MTTRSLFVLAATSMLVAVRAASAQTGIEETTIEARVASASLIVRATIADLKTESVDDQPTPGWKRTIVTLKVKETLKGKSVETVTFGEGGYTPDQRYKAWKEAGTEMLWFLGTNSLHGKSPQFNLDEIHYRFPLVTQFFVRLGPATAVDKGYAHAIDPMFLMDFTVVKGPDAILGAVKAAIPYPSDVERAETWLAPGEFPSETHSFTVPAEIMARSGMIGIFNLITVPIDRRLERLARRLVKSPGDYLPPLDQYARNQADFPRNADAPRRRADDEDELRTEGAKALRHFKSDENVALLKPLLADPSSTRFLTYNNGKPDEEFIEFSVRKAAYETLKSWGVAVDRPVIRAPIENKK